MAKISMKKSNRTRTGTQKSKVRKGADTGFQSRADAIKELVQSIDRDYVEFWDNAEDNYWNEQESRMYADIDEKLDELKALLEAYSSLLGSLPTTKSKTEKSKIRKYVDFDNFSAINVSRGGGDSGKNWDPLDFTFYLEELGEERALDDLYDKADSGMDRFTLHFNNWDYDIILIKSKSKKSETEESARDPSILLKKGWKVAKGEEEDESEDNTEETEEKDSDEDSEDVTEEIIETDEIEEAKKSAKKDPYKAMYALLKSKGWVIKGDDESEKDTDDQGPDSEDVEEEALGENAVADVPDTPEPTEDVQETETGVPDEPPLPESEDNETPTEEDGNGMENLMPKTINNLDLNLGGDVDEDIEEMIDKKRAEKEQGASLSTVGGMQPFKNNYRTVQMGEGKMDALSQMKVTAKRK